MLSVRESVGKEKYVKNILPGSVRHLLKKPPAFAEEEPNKSRIAYGIEEN